MDRKGENVLLVISFIAIVGVWLSFLILGVQNMHVLEGCVMFLIALAAYAMQVFIRNYAVYQRLAQENKVLEQALLTELERLKKEYHWNGNQTLDETMKKLRTDLKIPE